MKLKVEIQSWLLLCFMKKPNYINPFSDKVILSSAPTQHEGGHVNDIFTFMDRENQMDSSSFPIYAVKCIISGLCRKEGASLYPSSFWPLSESILNKGHFNGKFFPLLGKQKCVLPSSCVCFTG